MLRVMYKNAQLPIILATMARRRDLSGLATGVSKEHRGFKGCVSQSPDLNPIEHVFHHYKQNTKNDGTSRGRIVWHHSRVPDTCRIYAKAH
jgi:hypothetical protein